jgi:hypothetical protein
LLRPLEVRLVVQSLVVQKYLRPVRQERVDFRILLDFIFLGLEESFELIDSKILNGTLLDGCGFEFQSMFLQKF